ncbi:hypothetical protein KJ059_07820 [Myxococcota bacterium]|nr:hypothetical protein [Myxococcota bacterium]MCZ7618713.1 hypothetical protein [Myxococcota bacterium]
MRSVPTSLLMTLWFAILALPVVADPPSPGSDRQAGPDSGSAVRATTGGAAARTGAPRRITAGERFTVRERDLFRSWHTAEYGRGKCAPGLEKKTADCLPPGRQEKRYTIGAPLPGAIIIAPLPLDLARRVGSPPIGYRYAIVDGDLLKLTVDTTVVIDAVTGLTP